MVSVNSTTVRPTAAPTTGVSSTIRRSTTGCSSSPMRRISVPTSAATMPIPIAHRNSAPVGVPNGGMSGTASENVP